MGTNQKNDSRASVPEWPTPEVDGFEVFSGDLERFSTEDLVFFLESSFRKSEYEKVAAILSSREKSLEAEIERMRAAGGGHPDAKCKSLDAQVEAVAERCLELEEKSKKGEAGLGRRVSELEQKLVEERDRSASLEAKHRESEVGKLIASEEFEKSRRNCARLEEQLTRIKEDLGVVQVREKRALERIDALSAELEKKEKERREEFVELKAAIGDLELAKRRAEHERDEWKEKFGKLQVRALRLIEENAGIIEGQKSAKKEKRGKQSEENSSQRNVEDRGSHARMRCSTMLRVGSKRKEASSMQVKANAPSEMFIDITGSSSSDEEISATANTLKSAEKSNSYWRKVGELDYGNKQYKENCLCTSSSKRKHVSEMVASGRKRKNDDKDDDDDDDNDDRIPIGKLKIKSLEEATTVGEMLGDS
ncbi:apical junction molecule-like [Phoenix dactylifera]|uniref:Apical junction molecule-like n=1 Tax=Phoenix dactylifera TaxID=42345 RepID=A0A8B8J7X5_PHODC|nr:apical junction molecule-like [Phoenix dactylifera]